MAALAVGVTLQFAGFARAASLCDPMRIVSGAGLMDCCKHGAEPVKVTDETNCCRVVQPEEQAPAAATAGGAEVPPSPARWLEIALLLQQGTAPDDPEPMRRAHERPPPLASPIENIVLLN
jgi:hypothetical protein